MKCKCGFTFVEVIIAMAIFAILIVGVFPAFLIGIKLNAVSQVSVEISTQAQAAIEEVYGFSTTHNLEETVAFLTASYSAPVITGTTQTFTKTNSNYTIAITITPDSPEINMYRVLVTITKLNNPYGVHPAQAETILLFE